MKLAIAATIALATISAAYGAGQFTSKKLYTEIEINAPVSAVWKQLADTERYPEWNPFIKRISGELTEGNQLDVTIQSDDKSAMNFKPVILKIKDNQELRWVGRLIFPGIFDGEHYFVVEETSNGNTTFRHGETFSGMLSVLFGLIEDDTRKGFEAMNRALKQRVEAKT